MKGNGNRDRVNTKGRRVVDEGNKGKVVKENEEMTVGA